MSTKIKALLAAAAFTVLSIGVAPAALADGQRSVGSTVYEQVVHVTETMAGRALMRVIDVLL